MGLMMVNVLLAALKDGLGPLPITLSAVIITLFLLSRVWQSRLTFFILFLFVETQFFTFSSRLSTIEFIDNFRIFALLHDLLSGSLFVVGMVLAGQWLSSMQAGSIPAWFERPIPDKTIFPFWKRFFLSSSVTLTAFILTVNDMRIAMDPYVLAISNNIFGGIAVRFSFLLFILYALVKFWLVWLVFFLYDRRLMKPRMELVTASAFLIASGFGIFYLK